MRRHQGIGLTELLIALLISSILMTGLISHYITTKKQYERIQTDVEQRIDLQLVSDLIRDSTRRAGFTPCLSIDHLVTLDQRDRSKKLVAIEISSNEQAWLKINRMKEYFDTVLQIISPFQLVATKLQPLHRGQSVLIADCYHAEVQTIKQVKLSSEGQRLIFLKPLAFAYHEPVYLGEWLEETFSIRLGYDAKKSLFYKYQRQHSEELTSVVHQLSSTLTIEQGISSLRIMLGLDKARLLELETLVRAC
jgi:hypothetical protein